MLPCMFFPRAMGDLNLTIRTKLDNILSQVTRLCAPLFVKTIADSNFFPFYTLDEGRKDILYQLLSTLQG